jgi:hypothetical protein
MGEKMTPVISLWIFLTAMLVVFGVDIFQYRRKNSR